MNVRNSRPIQNITPATGSGFAGCSGFVTPQGVPTPSCTIYLLSRKTRLGEEHLLAGPFFCLRTTGSQARVFSLSKRKGWFVWPNIFSLPAA